MLTSLMVYTMFAIFSGLHVFRLLSSFCRKAQHNVFMHDNRESHRRHDRSGHQPWPRDSHAAASAQAGDDLRVEEHASDTSAVGAEARDTAAESVAKQGEVPAAVQVKESDAVPHVVGGAPSDEAMPSHELPGAVVVEPADRTTSLDTAEKSVLQDADTDVPVADRSTVVASTVVSDPAAVSGATESDVGAPDVSGGANEEFQATAAEALPVTTHGEDSKGDDVAAEFEDNHGLSVELGEDTTVV